MKRFYLLLAISLLLVACSGGSIEPAATAVAQVENSPVQTNTPEATDTPKPTATYTPIPTHTSEPTDTPVPTKTPLPTDTPEPTVTPIPTKTPFPTDTPTPAYTATPSPPPVTATPAVFPIGSLAGMPDDSKVTIAGNVVYTESFSKGFKFTVADETGRVILLMWQDTYDTFAKRSTLNVGSAVVVEGRVGRFDGELQVTPWNAESVQLTKDAYPWAQPVQVNQLAGKLDQRVMVEGTVSRASSNQYGTEIFVNDGTGEVEVFIWSNIFNRMPNQDTLQTPGTDVRVVGNVGAYRGQYQILPVLPYDMYAQ